MFRSGLGHLSFSHGYVIGWTDKGVMEVGDGGGLPGASGQGAREETTFVVDKVGDDDIVLTISWESW